MLLLEEWNGMNLLKIAELQIFILEHNFHILFCKSIMEFPKIWFLTILEYKREESQIIGFFSFCYQKSQTLWCKSAAINFQKWNHQPLQR